MENERSAKIVQELSILKASQEKLFHLGFNNRQNKIALLVTLLSIGAGIFGIISTLYEGINIYYALAILAGALALYRSNEKDKVTKYCRDQYRKNLDTIAALEDEHKTLTFVPDTPEEWNRKWLEFRTEMDQIAANRPPI
ncbi:hypothetical protein [Pseudomonas fluorescens]|uniref:hypothetical protein n=1 Tax=Pseudomonas fluorescens TaxID=294 RepID=UPI001CA69085|nr:hypothetical protein [Pseudomonas fluorescens]MBY8934238.1 hypothetical protein [Pseudomonas fluorescens]